MGVVQARDFVSEKELLLLRRGHLSSEIMKTRMPPIRWWALSSTIKGCSMRTAAGQAPRGLHVAQLILILRKEKADQRDATVFVPQNVRQVAKSMKLT
jgi:hypothetical protein